ncbi:hypothetical protein ACWD25_02310 [Streptomyces sp. NPDC002920]
MSGETVLRIQPGESTHDFIRRVADTAPQAPPDVLVRVRDLLRIDVDRLPERAAPDSAARAAA